MSNILIIALGHDENDRRVNRTIEVALECGFSVTILYERKRSVRTFPAIPNVLVRYLDIKMNVWSLLFPSVSLFEKAAGDLISFDIIYVHDSGLYGVALVSALKKISIDSKVIFDYHDWIKWDIFYQLNKYISIRPIVSMMTKFIYYLFTYYHRNKVKIDAMVGISASQIQSFIADFNINLAASNVLPIPNTRILVREEVHVDNDNIYFVWIGNIMPGRSIDRVLLYVRQFRQEHPSLNVRLALVGRKMDSFKFEFFEDFVDLLGEYISDEDIVNILPKSKCIGIFFGWDDWSKTDINKIASPNKIYSYINVGIPFIYDGRLENISQSLGNTCSLTFSEYGDFKLKANDLIQNYSFYSSNVKTIKQLIEWDLDVSVKLATLFRGILRK